MEFLGKVVKLTIFVSLVTLVWVTPTRISILTQLSRPEGDARSKTLSAEQYSDPISAVPTDLADASLSFEDILSDRFQRIGEDFRIPDDLRKRVGFWLSIYSKYSSRFSIIHDSENPWIIYRVVDLRPIYERNINEYAKAALDEKFVRKNLAEVRSTLAQLGNKVRYDRLSEEEKKFVDMWSEFGRPSKSVFRNAAQHVRDQRGQKNFMKSGIINSHRYIREMEAIFARYDLPTELVRLPLVESSFNENAMSKVGASGIWQFMVSTGKAYLKVSDQIDERNSPLKATEAAARLMLQNFRTTRSWPLAITAYNHGAGGLIRAAKKLRTNNLADIIEGHNGKTFGFASQNFFCEFLAALHSEKYQDFIFGQINKSEPQQSIEVPLKSTIRIGTLVELSGMTLEEIRLYNPDLRTSRISAQSTLEKGYVLRVPPSRKSRIESTRSKTARATGPFKLFRERNNS